MADSSNDSSAADAAARKQKRGPLDSDERGVAVALNGDRYHIKFAYSQTLMKLAKAIPGAKWDSTTKSWTAPAQEYDAVKSTVGAMRETRLAMDDEKSQIERAVRELVENAKIIEVHVPGSRTSGEVVALGDHYLAQKIQSKEGDIVSLHERSALALTKQFKHDALSAGQDVSIFYLNGAGLVSSREPERALASADVPEPSPKPKPKRGSAVSASPARA